MSIEINLQKKKKTTGEVLIEIIVTFQSFFIYQIYTHRAEKWIQSGNKGGGASDQRAWVLKHSRPPATDSPRTPDVYLDVGPPSHISAGRSLAVIISFDGRGGLTNGRRSRNAPTIILLLGRSSPRFYIPNGLFRSQMLLLV